MTKHRNKGTVIHVCAAVALCFGALTAQAQSIRMQITGQITVPTVAQPISDLTNTGRNSINTGISYTVEKYSNPKGSVIVVVSYC